MWTKEEVCKQIIEQRSCLTHHQPRENGCGICPYKLISKSADGYLCELGRKWKLGTFVECAEKELKFLIKLEKIKEIMK